MTKLKNILQLNDWNLRSFIIIVISTQVLLFSLIYLDLMGSETYFLRAFVGFLYLTFLPGFILLRVLKIHKLGNTENILYAIGLSIGFLMFIGYLMNICYPIFGIIKPISLLPLLVTFTILFQVFLAICSLNDKGFSEWAYIEIRDVVSSSVIYLCQLPLAAILGTYMLNFKNDTTLLMILILLIILTISLCASDIFIHRPQFPLAIFMISISLLFHSSLVSMYLTGWDIHAERQFQKLVELNGYWDSSIPFDFNSVLSSTIFPSIYANILGLDIIWIYKIIFPFFVAFIPVGLYIVFKSQTEEQVAFLAAIFFISQNFFYTELLALTKQQLAEYFYMLLIILLVAEKPNLFIKKFLCIAFGFGIIVSHYGTTYLIMFFFIISFFISLLLNLKNSLLTSKMVMFFIITGLIWYISNSESSAFEAIVHAGDTIINSLYSEFLSPDTSQPLSILTREIISPLHEIFKYLYIISIFFISIGVVQLFMDVIRKRKVNFKNSYITFSFASFITLAMCIAVPHFDNMNIHRLFHILLFFLSPFFVLGGIAVFRMLTKLLNVPWTKPNKQKSFRIISLFLLLFILFSTGWIYEITKDNPNSISLSPYIDSTAYTEQEALAAMWLSSHSEVSSIVIGDIQSIKILFDWFHYYSINRNIFEFFWNTTTVENTFYIYLRQWNLKYGEILYKEKIKALYSLNYFKISNNTKLSKLINRSNNIYNNEIKIYLYA